MSETKFMLEDSSPKQAEELSDSDSEALSKNSTPAKQVPEESKHSEALEISDLN